MTGPPVSIDSLLGPPTQAPQHQAPVKLDDLLGAPSAAGDIEQTVVGQHPEIMQLPPEYRHGAVQDEVTDAWMKQHNPAMRVIPRELRIALAHGGREVVGGAIDFFKKFGSSTPPSLEQLRQDEANFDTYTQPVLTGAGQQIGQTPQQKYGSKENLQRLIHRSIIARAEGRELTPNDVAMAFVPPYAIANMLHSTASRLLDIPAIALGAEPVPPSSTKLREMATALVSGTIQLGMVAGGAREGAEFTKGRLAALRARVISTPVEASQAAAHVESVNTFAAIQERLRTGPSPELAGIKERLIAQDNAVVTSALINAHRDLNLEGTTIIPGVQRASQVIANLDRDLYRRGEVPAQVATYKRPDGSYDIALYGRESPLMEADYLRDFERYGHFYGQEVSVKGVDAVFLGPKEPLFGPGHPLQEFKLRKISDGTEVIVPLELVRRKAITQSGLVRTMMVVGHEPLDPFKVLREAHASTVNPLVREFSSVNRVIPSLNRVIDEAHDLMINVAHSDFKETYQNVRSLLGKIKDQSSFENTITTEAAEHARSVGQDAAPYLKVISDKTQQFAKANHRLPVFNEVQMMARRAAVEIGKWQFTEARAHLEVLQDLLSRGPEEFSKAAGEVHAPPKVIEHPTEVSFEKSFGPRASGVGAFYRIATNEVHMRPKSHYHSGYTWEYVLSHEVGHAMAERMITYNPELASEMLRAARGGNTDLANGGVHPETVAYIKMLDDEIKAGKPSHYNSLIAMTKEVVAEELAHRYPVTPLQEMFSVYRTEFRRAALDDVYRDFREFNHEIMTKPRLFESPILNNLHFPDVSNLEAGPLKGAIASAKRYFTKEEIVGEFQRKAAEDNIPVSSNEQAQIERYGEVVEHHSMVNSFERQLERFADTRGIPRESVPGLNNYIGQKMAAELRQTYQTPEEFSIYEDLRKELSKSLGRPATALETLGELPQLPLATEAATNGFQLSYSPNGEYVLRGIYENTSGSVVGRFHTEAAAREFINRSGQVDGPSLTPPTNVPDQVGGAVMPPSGGKLPPTYGPEDGLNSEYDHSDKGAIDKGRLGKAVDVFRASFDMITGREASFESVDNLFGSKFASIQRGLEAAKGLAEAGAHAFKEKYLDPIGSMLKGLKKEQFANVFRYIEAKSPGELMGEMIAKGRHEAVDIARTLAELRVDSAKAIEFSRKVEGIKDDMKGQPQDAVNMEIEKLRAAMGLDNAHVVAGGIYEGLRKRDINAVPIHEIARLADALMWDAPNRAEFAKLAGMTPKEILIAHRFDNLFEQAAKIQGIPDFRLISGYISHFRSQLGGDIPTPEASVLFQKGLGSTMESAFVNEFIRTGELSAVDLNPYTIALRYIDSAFKARDFVPTYREALKNWDLELNKLKGGAFTKWIADGMADRVKRYASDLRGFPAPVDAMMRAGISALNKHLGTTMSPTLVENLVRRSIAWTGTALLAFRPYIGLRHLAQFEQFAGVRFGFRNMHEGLRLAEMDGAIQGLKDSGVLSGLSYTALVTPEEAAANMLTQAGGSAWKAYEMFAKAGHAATLLPTIYEHTYSAVYLGMRKLALDNLNELSNGKLGKVAAYDNLALDSFAPSFRAEFDGLVRAGKIDEAAALIAKRAAKETIFDYQRANAPRGWNSTPGRLLTQYGTWSLHASELVTNMVTRGSMRHRVNYMARFGMAQAATYLAGRSVGIDLLGATVAHSLFWTGSPQVQLLQTAVTAINGQGVEQRLAQDRLFKLVPGLRTSTMGGERRFEFDFNPDTVDPRSMFIPGSYALGDWMRAIQERNDHWGRYTIAQQGARALGAPTIGHRSWVDDYMEQFGLHFYDYARTTQP